MPTEKPIHELAKAERKKHTDAILNSPSHKKIVVAGPGTGKTHLFNEILTRSKNNLTLTFINALVEDLALELNGISEVKTAIESADRFCCAPRFRSTVTNTSNSLAASASSSPFLTVVHPICLAVLTSCPTMSRTRRNRRTRPAGFSRHRFDQPVLGFLQERDHLRAIHTGKAPQKVVDRFAAFEIIEQRLHRHARAGKHPRAAHDLGIACDDRLFHASNLSPAGLAGNFANVGARGGIDNIPIGL
jgi:hypothetical protein